MLLTTQYLEEADRFADTVHVLHHGKIIASGTPGQLKSMAGGEGSSLDDAFLALTRGSGTAPEAVAS
jgi:ABC-type multidrug transport system ATPase subunit